MNLFVLTVLQTTGTLVAEGAEESGSEAAEVRAQALELSLYRNRSRTLRRQELHADN